MKASGEGRRPIGGQGSERESSGGDVVIVDAGDYVREPGLRIDVVEFGGLCRPPNYAERFWKQPVIYAHLRPVERTSPQFHIESGLCSV